MHSIVTTFRGAVIKVEVANFCAVMDTLIDQDDIPRTFEIDSAVPAFLNTCQKEDINIKPLHYLLKKMKFVHIVFSRLISVWFCQSVTVI